MAFTFLLLAVTTISAFAYKIKVDISEVKPGPKELPCFKIHIVITDNGGNFVTGGFSYVGDCPPVEKAERYFGEQLKDIDPSGKFVEMLTSQEIYPQYEEERDIILSNH